MITKPHQVCPSCAAPAFLVTGQEVYPHRPDLGHKWFWACLPCQVWAGCHGDGRVQKARLAGAETRALRIAAHAAFDPLWKSGRMNRNAAYAWLRKQTGLSERECHMGWMSDADLRRVIELCGSSRT